MCVTKRNSVELYGPNLHDMSGPKMQWTLNPGAIFTCVKKNECKFVLTPFVHSVSLLFGESSSLTMPINKCTLPTEALPYIGNGQVCPMHQSCVSLWYKVDHRGS